MARNYEPGTSRITLGEDRLEVSHAQGAKYVAAVRAGVKFKDTSAVRTFLEENRDAAIQSSSFLNRIRNLVGQPRQILAA